MFLALQPNVAMVKHVVTMVKHVVAMVKHVVAMLKLVVAMAKHVVAMVKHVVAMVKHVVVMVKLVVAMAKHVVAIIRHMLLWCKVVTNTLPLVGAECSEPPPVVEHASLLTLSPYYVTTYIQYQVMNLQPAPPFNLQVLLCMILTQCPQCEDGYTNTSHTLQVQCLVSGRWGPAEFSCNKTEQLVSDHQPCSVTCKRLGCVHHRSLPTRNSKNRNIGRIKY